MRSTHRNADGSYTFTDGERTETTAPGLTLEQADAAEAAFFALSPPVPAAETDPAIIRVDQMLADNLISVNRYTAMVALLAL